MATRKTLIQLIHIGAGKLFKDEDSRRDWQEQHTGKRSCSKMTDRELEHLVKLLRDAKAIKPPKRAGRKPNNPSNYIKKIEALLADMGLNWAYAESIAKRVAGVERLEWVHKKEHFDAIVAALYNEQKKRKLLADIEYHLDALNLDDSYIEQLVAGRKDAARWKRSLALLGPIADNLREKLAFEQTVLVNHS